VYCTHLDFRKEQLRLAQLEQIMALIEQHGNTNKPHLLVGDLNSLSRTDYSEEIWQELGIYRQQQRWEPPLSQVTDRLRQLG
jgi:endonuclease/exonuclease/phosphatase family metal-dependent hydrolase